QVGPLEEAYAEIHDFGYMKKNIHFRIPEGNQGIQGVDGARGKNLEFRFVNYEGNEDPVNGTQIQVKQEGGAWSAGIDLRGAAGLDGATGPQGPKGDSITLSATSETIDSNSQASANVSIEADGRQNIHIKIPRGLQGAAGLDGAPGKEGQVGPKGEPGFVDYSKVYDKEEVDEKISNFNALISPVFETGIAINTGYKSGIELNGTKTAGAPDTGLMLGETSGLGLHGKITSEHAVYFSNSEDNSGWIFSNATDITTSLSVHGDLFTNSITTNSIVAETIEAVVLSGDLVGNSSTTTELLTPVTISLTGRATGSAQFNGKDNIEINVDTSEAFLVEVVDKTLVDVTHDKVDYGVSASKQIVGYTDLDGYDGVNTIISINPNYVSNLESNELIYQMSVTKDGFFTRGARPTDLDWQEWRQSYDTVFHPEANKLSDKRNIKLIGGALGEVDFDGSENVEMTVVVDPDSHHHDESVDIEYVESLLKSILKNHGMISDFNNATTTGLYSTETHCLNSPIVDIIPPEGEEQVLSTTIGTLIVDAFQMQSTTQIVKQIFFAEGESTYHRSYNSIKLGWSDWVQFYDSKYKPMADKLTTPVRINGVAFDGSTDITLSLEHEHQHHTSDITSGILPLMRGGIGVDGNSLQGFIKRDKFTNVFTSSPTVDWSEIVNIPEDVLAPPGSGTIVDVPDATLTTKGIVKLSETYNNSISEAATPKMVTILKDNFDAHHHDLQYSALVHRHDWNEVDNKQIGDFYNFGLSKVWNGETLVEAHNQITSVPNTRTFLQKLDEADGVVDGVIDDILAELDKKSNLDHIHKASDVTTGVFPVSRGGTGSSFFENKYIVKSSGRDNLTSIAKIPLEDIDHDFSVEGLYAPFEHKHVWLDIDQTTVPLASEIERGIVYLVDSLLSPSDQSALSSRAAIEKFTEITDKIDSLNGDFAMREHTHNWIDINESTIPLASTSEYGIVKLSSSLSSREETIGATSRAVSDLYDLVQGASGDYASRVHYH
ncbi:MAG: tail fiber protein, partial [Fusobacteriaceae bacterium]